MKLIRARRGLVAFASAVLIAGASGSVRRGQSSGGKDRILTLTVWIHGTGQVGHDVHVNDPRDGPGNMDRRSALSDSATAYCLGITSYRVVAIWNDGDGGVELQQIESKCPQLGLSGGGSHRSSDHYTAKYFDGVQWRRDQGTWTYVLGDLKEPWRGPQLEFLSSREFKVTPPALPVLGPSSLAVGKGVEEFSNAPKREYVNDFPHYARAAVNRAFGEALSGDKAFEEKMKGRLDWSKSISISGRASLSRTERQPISLVQLGGEEVTGGDEIRVATIEVDWALSDEPAPVEMDLIPQPGYESWLPRGGKDEKTPGSSFAVEIDIHKAGQPGAAPEAEVKKLRVWLADTSRQPGVCLNVPKSEKATAGYDFQVRPASGWTVKNEGQEAEADEPKLKSTVLLDGYDYGGWTQVMATAELADGRIVVGQVKEGSKSSQLAIPKDDNRNHIAERWEVGRTVIEATADTDGSPPGNGVEGDGLSRYEEYRGFMSKGVHTRTDPAQKDLFIHDPGNLGIGLFGASGLTVHFVDAAEFDQEAGFANTNVINGNRDFAALGPQHLLVLKNINLGGALTGLCIGGLEPGIPRTKKLVAVDKKRAQAPGEAGLAATIAHELSHACGVWHHGDIDYEAYDLEYLRKSDGEWHPVGGRGPSGIVVAARGGQESGVEECIMRYITSTAGAFEREDGDLRWRKKSGTGPWILGTWTPTLEDHPHLFCDQAEGTGINAPGNPGGSFAGDATVGDCLHWFQVNDLKPPKRPGGAK